MRVSVWSSQLLIHSLKPFDLLQIAASIIYSELSTYFGKLYWFSPVSCIPTRCFKMQNFSWFHDYWLLPQFSETSVSAWNKEVLRHLSGALERNLTVELNNNKSLLRMLLSISFLQFSRFQTSLYGFYLWDCLGSYVSIFSCSHMCTSIDVELNTQLRLLFKNMECSCIKASVILINSISYYKYLYLLFGDGYVNYLYWIFPD